MNTTITDSVAGELRALRARRKVTQEFVAQRFDVAKSTVKRWENGEAALTLRMLHQWAEIFEVSVSEILRRAGY